jgi:hypothetical protein
LNLGGAAEAAGAAVDSCVEDAAGLNVVIPRGGIKGGCDEEEDGIALAPNLRGGGAMRAARGSAPLEELDALLESVGGPPAELDGGAALEGAGAGADMGPIGGGFRAGSSAALFS